MKAIRFKGTGGLERLTMVEMNEPGASQEGEIMVQLHASSLNCWADQVLDRTDGRGVDHAIEVRGPGTLPQSVSACRIGGHIERIDVYKT